MISKVGCLLSGVGLMSMVACSRTPSEPPPLSEAVVTLPGFDSLRVEFTEGEGEIRTADGTLVVRAGLTDWSAIGDLDGDERAEAVAVIWSTGGGSGSFMELAAFDLERDGWVWRGSVPLGDRVRVRVFAVTDDEVLLHLTEHGPDDAMCCPTVRIERRYRLSARDFQEVAAPDTPG